MFLLIYKSSVQYFYAVSSFSASNFAYCVTFSCGMACCRFYHMRVLCLNAMTELDAVLTVPVFFSVNTKISVINYCLLV